MQDQRAIASVLLLTLLYLLLPPSKVLLGDKEIDMREFVDRRVDELWQQVKASEWPKSPRTALAPHVDKSILPHPELVTEEYGPTDSIGDGPRAIVSRRWDWRNAAPNPNPPTTLPEEYMRSLENRPFPDARIKKKYIDGRIEEYKRNKARITRGQLTVTLSRAENSESAHRSMVGRFAMSSMPDEAIAHQFSEARKLDVGTVGFGHGGTVRFVRNNVGVEIRAEGVFVPDALPLARKLDELIQKQPTFLPGDPAPRPTIQVSPSVEATGRERKLPVQIAAPAGQHIVSSRAWINGQPASVKDGAVNLTGRPPGPATLVVEAITESLLWSRTETQIVIPPAE